MIQVVKNNPEITIPNQYILGRPISKGRAKTVRSSSSTSGFVGFGTGLQAHVDFSGGVSPVEGSSGVSRGLIG